MRHWKSFEFIGSASFQRNGNATGKFHSRTISAGTFESMGKSSSKYGLIIRPMDPSLWNGSSRDNEHREYIA